MTDAPAWTPGPWSPHGVRIEGGGQIVAHAELMRRQSWDEGNDEAKANAHLIAAAPDLYAALDHYCQNYLLDEYEEPELTGIDQPQYEAVSALFAALRKARGES